MQSEQPDGKPVLDGIKLIDLSIGIAGPYSAMLLADQGADCLKVEPHDGDPARSLPGFYVWNRGKKGITLNLETDEARKVLYQLIKKADIIIESYNPGQAEDLGVDYQSLSEINPRLIYCAIPPFGEKGPLREKFADEGIIAAWSGLMSGQGGIGRAPIYLTTPIASYGTAFLAAYGISAALFSSLYQCHSPAKILTMISRNLSYHKGWAIVTNIFFYYFDAHLATPRPLLFF